MRASRFRRRRPVIAISVHLAALAVRHRPDGPAPAPALMSPENSRDMSAELQGTMNFEHTRGNVWRYEAGARASLKSKAHALVPCSALDARLLASKGSRAPGLPCKFSSRAETHLPRFALTAGAQSATTDRAKRPGFRHERGAGQGPRP